MPKILISYSQKDGAIARKLTEKLKYDGADIWIDVDRIEGGNPLAKKIEEALESCDIILLLWSKSASASNWVNRELEIAIGLDKEIIPCTLDDARLRTILIGRLHIDLREFASGYERICRALKITPLPPETKAVEKATESENVKRGEKKKEVPAAKPEVKTLPHEKEKSKTSVYKPGHKQTSSVFRSEPATLSKEQVQTMLRRNDFFDSNWNKNGRGFEHRFELQTIKGDKVVFDHASNLLWQQAGSTNNMTYEKVKEWLTELNNTGFAGYFDWRLPTLEEAMSLMEVKRKNGELYIDPVFDKTQWWIWTSDQVQGVSRAWVVNFSKCYCDINGSDNSIFYVRAVRTGQSSF